MNNEWIEVQERLHGMRNEVAGRAAAQNAGKAVSSQTDAGARLVQLDHAISRIELGLYPLCEHCGARIEMERLRETPELTFCLSCETSARWKRG